MRRVFVSAASNARKWVQGETLLMRRVLVSAASNARKWVQGKALLERDDFMDKTMTALIIMDGFGVNPAQEGKAIY